MARGEATSRNELHLHDNLSDTPIVFYYRMPTTREREGFSNEAIQRKGKKIKFRQAETRLKYGLKVLTGIRKGDFERMVDGKPVAFASDANDPEYFKDWKVWLKDHAADLVMLLGAHIFEGSAEIEEPDEDEDAAPNSSETLPQ